MKILRCILLTTIILTVVGLAVAQDNNKKFSDDDYFILKYIAPNASQQEQLRILDSIRAASPLRKIKPEVKKDSLNFVQPKADSIQPPPPPDIKERDVNKLSPDELFRLAFKTERVRANYFIVRFFADGKSFGTTEISFDSAFTSFNFYSVPFSQYLDSVLLANERPIINGTDGHFNSKRLKDFGFELNLNEQAYELHLELPPEIKKMQYLNLGRTSEPVGTLIKPAFFSFFANLRANESYRCDRSRYDDYCERGLVDLNSDAALAMFGFALEGSANFIEPRSHKNYAENFRRGDIRLVKDIYSINSRLSFGDVGEVAGIRYEHSDRLFNRNRLTEKHKINFYLQRAAYVEIHIDGKMSQRLYLPSGFHEISGFAGHTGQNLVQVFIPKRDGTMEEVKYQFELGDARTMQKGESRYYINGGIRRTFIGGPITYRYHPDEPGLTANYFYGLFYSTSIGYNIQLSEQNLSSGLQISNANPLGYTELRGSVNGSDSTYKIGKRLELMHYINFDKPFRYIPSIDISLSGYIQNSSYNSSLFIPQSFASAEFAGFSGSLDFGGISAAYNVAFNRDRKEDGFADIQYGIYAYKSIKMLNLNANIGANSSKASKSYYFAINAGYSFGVDRSRISLTGGLRGNYDRIRKEDAKSGNANLNWSWRNGGSNAGGHSYMAGIRTSNNFDTKSSSLNTNLATSQYFNRAELSASYQFSKNESSISDRQSMNMRASFGASFMFADGLWAFGRPVNGGFILADADNSLAGSTVRMNYSRAYRLDLSHSGWLGAAYQNNISNYNINPINISLKDIPPGAWLEQNQYYVTGAYKQGYALKLGNDMRVLMQVKLKDERGALSNIYVAIFQLDNSGKIANKRITFTSKEGVLQMGNLIPGAKYRLTFDPSTYIKNIDMEIPKDSEPFMEMPDIKVERE